MRRGRERTGQWGGKGGEKKLIDNLCKEEFQLDQSNKKLRVLHP